MHCSSVWRTMRRIAPKRYAEIYLNVAPQRVNIAGRFIILPCSKIRLARTGQRGVSAENMTFLLVLCLIFAGGPRGYPRSPGPGNDLAAIQHPTPHTRRRTFFRMWPDRRRRHYRFKTVTDYVDEIGYPEIRRLCVIHARSTGVNFFGSVKFAATRHV